MKIRVLPDTVINQIAAGEVVERPASVIRELVDNAVDAGATDVFVALEGGGHSRLKVRDNGCGMSKDEAILAFERHATSKVSCIDDLASLETLGFRGEALASIAAVSKVHLRTRSKDVDVGTHIVFRGGKLSDVQSIPWNVGTEIEVEHLFFNTPARRKFLKSPRSEAARVRTWIAHSGLARPLVRYRLVSDGDEVLHLQPVATIAERARSIFPADLMAVSLSEGGIAIEGLVSHPGQALSDQSGFVTLINGRLVADKIVQRAVREGYDSMLKDREYPTGYLSLTLPSDQVDVNVHPQKSEVRFRHPQQIFAIVQGAVTAAVRSIRRPMQIACQGDGETLNNSSLRSVGQASRFEKIPIEATVPLYQAQNLFDRQLPAVESTPDEGNAQFSAVERRSFDEAVREVPSAYMGLSNRVTLPAQGVVQTASFRFSNLRYIGQVLECYLVCEHDERLVVVDMHAAHERVNYNRIRKARAEQKILSQRLLIPETVRLTEESVVALMEQEHVLQELGFELSQISPETVTVRGVPGVVAHVDCVALLKECAAEPLAVGWRERLEERIDHIAARMACHASVRSGDILTKQEAYALFMQLDEVEISGACPHGRPVVTQFSREMVERWFGRDR
jgi:DNA mismatch repair protein MutL